MALSDSDKIRLIEDHCRSFWEGDLRDFDHQLAPGYRDTGAGPGTPDGVEGAKAWARTCRRASPDMRVVVTDALVAGDVIAVRATWSGTHTGWFKAQPPTGERIELDGIAVWELDEQGRIVHRTGFVDGATTLAEGPASQRSTPTREGAVS